MNYCVFSVQTCLILQRVDIPTTTPVQLIVTEQCGKSSLFTVITENSSLAGLIVCFGTYFERCASWLGLDVLGAEWRIRLSGSGSHLIHGETLSVQRFHLNGQK